MDDLSNEFESLISGDLASVPVQLSLMRYFRVNRGAVVHHALVARVGLALRGLGAGRVGDDYWSILEQTLVSCLYSGKKKEAEACLLELQGRFGAFVARKEERKGEDVTVTPQSGSYRVRVLELLVRESGASKDESIREYKALLEQRATLTAPGKRTGALLGDPHKQLSEHLEAHPGDAPAWHELGEHYVAASRDHLPLAIHCYEDLVLSAPNSAGWHARLSELHCSQYAGDGLGKEGALAALRQARLHASEAVRLTDGGVAYAAAALADAAYLHVCAILASGKQGSGVGGGVPLSARFLKGKTLHAMAKLAVGEGSSSSSSSSSGGGGGKGGGGEGDITTTTLSPYNFALADALDFGSGDEGDSKSQKSRVFLEEALALHSLALHYMECLRKGAVGERCRAFARRPALSEAQGGGTMLGIFPALAVEHWLLESAEASATARVQAAHLKLVAGALQASN